MATTFKIRPETAKRAQGMIAYHKGDLAAAIHDVRIGLQSLGNYTDRKSEAVLDVLEWIRIRDERFPESIERRRAALAAIAVEAQL